MKKFVLRTLVALLPLLLVLAAAERYVRSLPNTYQYKESWMRQHGHRVATLVLGNSHAYYDLVPGEMGDSVFSLANVSQRTEHDFFLLRRYASCCPRLRRVVMVADCSNLFDVPMEHEEPGRATYYQLYMDYPKHGALSRYGFELSSMTSFWAKVRQAWRRAPLDCDSLGWGRGYRWQARPAQIPGSGAEVKRHPFHGWAATMLNCRYVDSVAAWCAARHVQLVLLQPPVSRAYTRAAAPWQLRFVADVARRCCQRYGATVADYSCHPAFSDDDFYDDDHLCDRGARRFSRLLADELH